MAFKILFFHQQSYFYNCMQIQAKMRDTVNVQNPDIGHQESVKFSNSLDFGQLAIAIFILYENTVKSKNVLNYPKVYVNWTPGNPDFKHVQILDIQFSNIYCNLAEMTPLEQTRSQTI